MPDPVSPERRAWLLSFSDVVIERRHPKGSRSAGSYAVYFERRIKKVRSLAARKVFRINGFAGTQLQASRLSARIAAALANGEEPELPPTA